jgi:hypothetical protein
LHDAWYDGGASGGRQEPITLSRRPKFVDATGASLSDSMPLVVELAFEKMP